MVHTYSSIPLIKLIWKISFNALLTSFDVHQADNAGLSKFLNGYPQKFTFENKHL